MAQSREDKIRLAYALNRKALEKEALDRVHARALLYVSEKFNISPLVVDSIVKSKK